MPISDNVESKLYRGAIDTAISAAQAELTDYNSAEVGFPKGFQVGLSADRRRSILRIERGAARRNEARRR